MAFLCGDKVCVDNSLATKRRGRAPKDERLYGKVKATVIKEYDNYVLVEREINGYMIRECFHKDEIVKEEE